MSSINWADLVKDAAANGGGGGFSLIPDGDYDLKVLEVTHKISSNGKPMFNLKAQIQTGPHANRLVWDNLVVSTESEKALGFFFRKMRALGLTEQFFQTGPDNDKIIANMVGKTFRGKIGSREWNQKKQNEIKEYYAVASSAPTAPSGQPQAPQPPQQQYAQQPPQAPQQTQAPVADPWAPAPPAPTQGGGNIPAPPF